MKNHRWFIAVLFVVILSLTMAACAGGAAPAEEEEEAPAEEEEMVEEEEEAPAEEEEMEEEEMAEEEEMMEMPTIKIGVMGPLTGGAAFLGQEQLNFAKSQIALFNEEMGYNIEVVEGDTMINADEGKIVAERFVADGDIYAVVGPAGSQVCEATQPVFEEAGMAHITPSCTRISLTEPSGTLTDTFFRPVPHDGIQGPTDADYMVNTLGFESAYLVDDQSSYSVGLTDELEANLNDLGVTAVERASVTQEDTDFSSLVTTIVASNPDVVFFPGQISSQLGLLVAQLREQGYEGTYFLGDGGFDISWVEAAGADAAEGTYLSFFAPDPHFVPEADAVTTYYAENFTEEFGAFGGPAALGAEIALEAIERCVQAENVSRECVRDEVEATDKDSSVLGIPVSFDENHDIEGARFFIFQVQGGEFALVE